MKKLAFVSGWGFSAEVFLETAKCIDNTTVDLISLGSLSGNFADSLARQLGSGSYDAVIGWSMGGTVLLEVALNFPDLIKKLILISSTACFVSSPEYTYGKPLSEIRKLKKQVNANSATALSDFSKLVSPDNNIKSFFDCRRLIDGLEYLESTNLLSRLSEVTIPVLGVHGEDDQIIPWQAGDTIAKALKYGSFVLFKNSSHALCIEKREEVAEQINGFLWS